MQIQRGLQSPDQKAVALTIGNLDGVHLGHQALLRSLREAAAARGLEPAIMVFEPQPNEFFAPEQAPARLTSLREKLEIFAGLGLQRVHVCRFDGEFARMTAQDFARALSEELRAQFVLIGDDFRFGSGRSGDFALLQQAGGQHGYTVQAMQSVTQDGVRVSSTAVRAALARGDLQNAARYLGRHYSISGHVEHGKKLGRALGFPTANIQLQHNRPPLGGVFVTRARIDGGAWLQGAASLGVRPAVMQNAAPVLEVHLLNFDPQVQIYGKHMHVEFLHKLREEEKFSSLDALKQQIARDVEHTQFWFKNNHV